MRNIKIFQLLRTFSKEEKKEFEDFISSPYISASRDYTSILKSIYNIFDNKNNIEEITNEEFYDTIFTGKKYNNKTLRNRLNELTNIAKKYIIIKESENENIRNDYLLLLGLKKRKLYNIFRNEFERINNYIDRDNRKTYSGAEIKMLSTFVYLENQDFKNVFDSYRNLTEYSITFFLENYYQMMIEYETQRIYGIKSDSSIAYDLANNLKADYFIKALEEKNDLNYLMVIIYYYLYKSFCNIKDETAYNKFSKIFFKNLDKLTYEQKNSIFGFMISRFFFLAGKTGKKEYYFEVFKLYNIKLKLGLISELKLMRYPSTAYRDYVLVGLKLKKLKWVEDFILKYSDELPLEIRSVEMNMAYSRLYIYKKEFDKALDKINNIKTSNYISLLDASRSKLHIYYEKLNFEEAFLEIDRIKHYIKNNTKKIPISVRKYSKEYIDFYVRLLKIRLSPNKMNIDFLYNDIQKTENLVSRNWFIDKIKEMKNEK